ncbi:MAG TPA: conjugal transfer protein TraC, partial [Chloroflexota bacterium]|nr:conjugal transfer protein TraC [Chloroflexota bacterium]
FDLPPPPGPAPGEAPPAGQSGEGPDEGEAESGADILAEQVLALLALVEIMVATPEAPLSAQERGTLDRALYATYAGAGISAQRATHARPAPLLRDLYAVLQAQAPADATAAGLAGRLHRYVEGSLAGLFGGPTNVALDRPFVVFSIQRLEPELRPLAIHLITTFVWGRVRRARRPRLLVVDEAWSVLQYPEGGAFLAGLARRARKYYLGLVTISQSVGDFLATAAGRAVLTNAALKLLLKQDGATVDHLVALFDLTAEERQFLLGAGKGEGLLLARGTRVALQVEGSATEHRLATTAPAEVATLDRMAEQGAGMVPGGPPGGPTLGGDPGSPGRDR